MKRERLDNMFAAQQDPDAERQKLIFDYERERENVIDEIERTLGELATHTGNRSLTRRKYRHGRSPNDYGYERK